MASPSRRGSRLVPLRAALPCREGGQKEGWELFVRLFLPAWSVCASCSSLHAAVGVQCVASATGRQMCSRSSMPERLSPRPHHAHAPGENRKAWWGAGRQCMLGWRPQARAVAAAGGTAHSADSSKLGLLSPELRDEVVVGLLVLPVILPQLVVVCCAWALLVCGRRIEAGRARKFRQVGCVGRHAERAAFRAPIPPRADGRLARRTGPSGPGLPRAGRAERGSQASASNSSSSSSSSTGSGRGSAGAAAAAAAAASAAAALAEAEEEEAAMSGLCPAHGGTARGWPDAGQPILVLQATLCTFQASGEQWLVSRLQRSRALPRCPVRFRASQDAPLAPCRAAAPAGALVAPCSPRIPDAGGKSRFRLRSS